MITNYFPMDATPLHLYKGKLKEALTLVVAMTPEERRGEAVSCWNDCAGQLQNIVEKPEPNFGTTLAVQDQQVLEDLSQSSRTFDNVVDCLNTSMSQPIHCKTSVAADMSAADLDSSLLLTPPIKVSSLDQYHSDNIMSKTLYGPELEDTIENINSIGTLIDDKLVSSALDPLSSNTLSTDYTPEQSGIPRVNDTTLSISNPQGNNLPESTFPLIKHCDNPLLLTVPKNQIDANGIEVPVALDGVVYSANGDQSQLGCTSLPGYISEKETNLSGTKAGKLSQAGIDISMNYDNMVLSNSLDCPGTSANITGDIGNGQFDRGPGVIDHVGDYQQFEQNVQHSTMALNPFLNLPEQTSAYLSCAPYNEMFTQSDRPLQQIQPYNFSNNNYLDAGSVTVSGSIDNNNTSRKYLYQNDYNEKLLSVQGPEMPGSVQNSGIQNDNSTIVYMTEVKTDSSGVSSTDSGSVSNFRNTCTLCGKSGFSTKGNLKRHWRAHSGEKPFKCEYCDSRFTEKKSLKIHVRRHTGEKPYKCHTCGKMFSQTGVLQSHMALHLNERKFDCQKCGKAFRQRSQLKLHLLRHDGVKRETCQTCMAKFLTKGDLERHCRIHTGERPYACKICNKTFTRQQSLNEHMNRHTGRKPYDCKYCEKTFSEMSACYKHAKTHKRQEQQQSSSDTPVCQN